MDNIQNMYAALAYKDVLTLDEVSFFTGLSKSCLYKLTAAREIPFYKPHGKNLFFKKKEVEEWMTSNRQLTNDEIESVAANYLLNKKGGRR